MERAPAESKVQLQTAVHHLVLIRRIDTIPPGSAKPIELIYFALLEIKQSKFQIPPPLFPSTVLVYGVSCDMPQEKAAAVAI